MVTLTDAELRALAKALDAYLPEFSYEIARIDLQRDRHEVAQEERVLRDLRRRIADAIAEPPQPAVP